MLLWMLYKLLYKCVKFLFGLLGQLVKEDHKHVWYQANFYMACKPLVCKPLVCSKVKYTIGAVASAINLVERSNEIQDDVKLL
jgi:hypothetical protein